MSKAGVKEQDGGVGVRRLCDINKLKSNKIGHKIAIQGLLVIMHLMTLCGGGVGCGKDDSAAAAAAQVGGAKNCTKWTLSNIQEYTTVTIRSRSATDFSRASSCGAVLTKLSPRMRDNVKVHMWA